MKKENRNLINKVLKENLVIIILTISIVKAKYPMKQRQYLKSQTS